MLKNSIYKKILVFIFFNIILSVYSLSFADSDKNSPSAILYTLQTKLNTIEKTMVDKKEYVRLLNIITKLQKRNSALEKEQKKLKNTILALEPKYKTLLANTFSDMENLEQKLHVDTKATIANLEKNYILWRNGKHKRLFFWPV